MCNKYVCLCAHQAIFEIFCNGECRWINQVMRLMNYVSLMLTPPLVPSLVQAVTYQNVSSTSIMAMWEPPLHPNGQITHYTIYSLNLNTQQAQTHTTGTHMVQMYIIVR